MTQCQNNPSHPLVEDKILLTQFYDTILLNMQKNTQKFVKLETYREMSHVDLCM